MAQGFERWVDVRTAPDRGSGRRPAGRGAAPGRGRHAAPAGRGGRLRGLLRLGAPRLQPRAAVPARQPRSPDAELEAPPRGLPRAGELDRRLRHRHRPALRPAQGQGRPRAGLRAVRPARHRGRARVHRRHRHASRATPSAWRTPSGTSSGWCCSTTGRRGTSRRGSTSRWAPTSASRSPRRSRRGSCPCWRCESARVATPRQEPEPLPYLAMREPWGLDVDLSVRVERRRGEPSSLPGDVLVARPDAGPPERQRGADAHG